MDLQTFLSQYWFSVAKQDAAALASFFQPDARILWHCTNEQFSVAEFIRANCAYPGRWEGEVERVTCCGSTVISVARVWDGDQSFHAVSFFLMQDDRIQQLDEYWGDDGIAPQWRQTMGIGSPILPK